ncbi:hypothetical protein TOC8171_25680 [Pseudomonas syringae]
MKEQSNLLDTQRGDVEKIGAASRELIKWEQELSDIKSKKTLTAEQQSLLTKQESITADLKRNALLEKEIELRKITADQAEKLNAYKATLDESNNSFRDGLAQQLAGAGEGEKYRARLKEMLSIDQDFNKQRRELYAEYKIAVDKNVPNAEQNYNNELALLADANAKKLEHQKDYYVQADKDQAKWMDGVKDAWKDYAAQAENYSAIAADFVSGSLADMTSGLGDAFSDIATGASSIGDAFADMAGNMAKSVINALSDMAAQWLVYQAVQLLVGNSTKTAGMSGLIANAQAASAQASLNAYASTAGIPLIGPAAAPAAALAAAAATAPMVAAVSASALAGMAHNGYDNIPKEGTWLLDGGERIVNPSQNRDLTKYLADKSGTGGGGGTPITIHAPVTVQAQPGVSDEDAKRQGRAAGEALAQEVRSVLQREMGQGGLLWKRT